MSVLTALIRRRGRVGPPTLGPAAKVIIDGNSYYAQWTPYPSIDQVGALAGVSHVEPALAVENGRFDDVAGPAPEDLGEPQAHGVVRHGDVVLLGLQLDDAQFQRLIPAVHAQGAFTRIVTPRHSTL